jgi:hypothetical protein
MWWLHNNRLNIILSNFIFLVTKSNILCQMCLKVSEISAGKCKGKHKHFILDFWFLVLVSWNFIMVSTFF